MNQKPDLIIHLAALAGVRKSIYNPISYLETNVNGTNNVLRAMMRSGVKNIIFASSSSVYGNNKKIPFAESDELNNIISPYALTKKIGEDLLRMYVNMYGINATALRFFTVYGPNQRHDLAIQSFTNKIRSQLRVPVYGDGSSARDYTYIDDIVDGIYASMDHMYGYKCFNLGGGKSIKLLDVIDSITSRLNVPALISFENKREGDVDITVADIRKAYKELGWKPKTDFENGMNKFIEHVRGSVPS